MFWISRSPHLLLITQLSRGGFGYHASAPASFLTNKLGLSPWPESQAAIPMCQLGTKCSDYLVGGWTGLIRRCWSLGGSRGMILRHGGCDLGAIHATLGLGVAPAA